jgi:hypothetical protein
VPPSPRAAPPPPSALPHAARPPSRGAAGWTGTGRRETSGTPFLGGGHSTPADRTLIDELPHLVNKNLTQ